MPKQTAPENKPLTILQASTPWKWPKLPFLQFYFSTWSHKFCSRANTHKTTSTWRFVVLRQSFIPNPLPYQDFLSDLFDCLFVCLSSSFPFPSLIFFISLFLYFWRPNLITGPSGWWTPINHLGPKRLYLTWGQGALLFLKQTLGESIFFLAFKSTLLVSYLRRSQDWFSRPKIERFFWRDFSGEELLPENRFSGKKFARF